MRRKDREITDRGELLAVMEGCDVVRLAIADGEVPYIVPLNFALETEGETVALYFHSAGEGRKLELLRKHPRVAFEMDRGHALYSEAERGYCTMEFESVMGQGRIEFLPPGEKEAALERIVARYHPEGFDFSRAAMPATLCYRLGGTDSGRNRLWCRWGCSPEAAGRFRAGTSDR